MTEASRVIEIEEVLEASRVSGPRCGTRSTRIAFLTASSSTAASITRSALAAAASEAVAVMRERVASAAPWSVRPRPTCRARLAAMAAWAWGTRSAAAS